MISLPSSTPGSEFSYQVGSSTGNVGGSHGSAGDGIGSSGRSDPGGEDGRARGKDIDDSAVVGVRSTGVRRGGGTNGDRGSLRSRGVVGGVSIIVSGGHGEGKTGQDSGRDGRVHSSRLGSTERHGGNGLAGETLGGSVAVEKKLVQVSTGIQPSDRTRKMEMEGKNTSLPIECH